MQKKILVAILTILLVILTSSVAFSAGNVQTGRHLTLMIYMCGSDLESKYGAASADIQEMLNNAPEGKEVTILLMTGGSKTWHSFNSNATMIHEIGSRGMRTIWRSDKDDASPMNMGNPQTLEMFLNYGIKNYPASEYALILWDHGGGPLNGVCCDELYSMDSLTLSEITSIFRDKTLPNLSWIGFDACLMNTLEVASALAPYADYMIASQETEPSTGWHYSFLSAIGNDLNGEDTGRRIIDAYFDHTDDQGATTLTLSCIRLAGIPALIAQADNLFGSIADELDEDVFRSLAKIRNSAVSMARIGPDADDWYDLVDLGDLLSFMRSEGWDTSGMVKAFSDTIVYQRSNNDRIHGISVYHPYRNRKQYDEQWHNDYLSMKSGQGYASYVFRFGSLLGEGSGTDWGGLKTLYTGKDESGSNIFQCALSEAQISDFVSGNLLILMPSESDPNQYTQIASIPVEADDAGNLTAVYNGKSLYAVSSDGSLSGPLCYKPARNETLSVVPVALQPRDEAAGVGLVGAFMALEGDQAGDAPRILTYFLEDSVTNSYTNRIPFIPEQYSIHYFQYQYRTLPQINNNGTLPGFESWERSPLINWIGIDPTDDFHMQYMYDQLSGRQLLAVFEITDTRQNKYCAAPIRVPNPLTQNIESITIIDNDHLLFSMRGQVINAPESKKLTLIFDCINRTGQEVTLKTDNITLNGTRMLGYSVSKKLKPFETLNFQISIYPEDLMDLSEITSLTADLTMENRSTKQMVFESSIHADCRIPVSEIAPPLSPITAVSHGGVVWNLTDYFIYQENDLGFTFLVQNQSGQDIVPSEYDLLVNGILVRSMCHSHHVIPSGSETIISYTIFNEIRTDSHISVEDVTVLFRKIVVSDRILQRSGHSDISEIRLVRFPSKWQHVSEDVISFPLIQPLPVPEFTPSDQNDNWYSALPPYREPDTVQLVSSEDYTIELGNILLADNGLVLCLTISNHTDDFEEINLKSFSLNDRPINFSKKYDVAPQSSLVVPLTITQVDSDGLTVPGAELRELSFIVEYLYDVSNPEIMLQFPESSVLGQQGGHILESVELTVQTSGQSAANKTDAVFEYKEKKDGTLEITSYSGMDKTLVIPSEINGKAVTSIGKDAFYHCSTLVRLTVSDGIKAIGDYAFGACDNLKSITLPPTVQSIGRSAFSFCSSLTEFDIPDGITTIQKNTFYYCKNLEEIRIPESVISIEDEAFGSCPLLTSIVIPDSVTMISANPFTDCDNLENISVSEQHPTLYVRDGVLFDRTEQRLICYPSAFQNIDYVIPDGTRIIGNHAFDHSKLTTITIPNTVTVIDDNAFYFSSKLVNIDIPNSVTTIGDSAFCGCNELISIRIPESVTNLGEAVFHYCSNLSSVSIPDTITVLYSNPFHQCSKLQEIIVSPNHPRFSIVDGALIDRPEQRLICYPAGLPVSSFTVPEGIQTIGEYAFSCCSNLVSIQLPDSLTTIEHDAFQNCSSLTDMTIPGSVTSIGHTAFCRTGFVSIVIPEGITVIDEYLFQSCPALTTVTLPESITTICEGAFSFCKSLTNLNIPAGVTTIAPDAFLGCDQLDLTIQNNSSP